MISMVTLPTSCHGLLSQTFETKPPNEVASKKFSKIGPEIVIVRQRISISSREREIVRLDNIYIYSLLFFSGHG